MICIFPSNFFFAFLFLVQPHCWPPTANSSPGKCSVAPGWTMSPSGPTELGWVSESKKLKTKSWRFTTEGEISNSEWDYRLSFYSRWFKGTQHGVTMPSRACLGTRVQTAHKISMTSALIPAGASWRQPGLGSYWILAAVWLPVAWLVGPTRLVQGRCQVWQGCEGGEDER